MPNPTPKKKKPSTGLKPGEKRVSSNYKSLYDQGGIDPGSIRNMNPSDTISGTWSKPGYRIDLDRSMTSTKGGRTYSQPEYIKLPKPKPEQKTSTTKKEVAPAKQKPEPVTAKLPTRKLTTTPVTSSIVKPRAAKPVKKEEAPKFEPTPGTKKLTKGSGSRTGNIGTAIKNAVGKQVFKSEAKKSAAYNRATSAVGTGSLAGMNKKERADELKGQMKDLKAAKKTNKTDVRAEMKDTKKALKWSEKVGSNKNQYLNIYGKKK